MGIAGYIVLGVIGLALVFCMVVGIMDDKKKEKDKK